MTSPSLSAAVVTVSDRCAAGERPDASGPLLESALSAAGIAVGSVTIIADGADTVESELRRLVATDVSVIVTTGGTGLGPRDLTPEGTARVLARDIPGISEEIRRRGALTTPTAVLSRGLAGVSAEGTLIVNLAGSPGAVTTGAEVLVDLIPHVVDQTAGGDHS